MSGFKHHKALILCSLLGLAMHSSALMTLPKDDNIGLLQLEVAENSALGQLLKAMRSGRALERSILADHTDLMVRKQYKELIERLGGIERVRVGQWYEYEDHDIVHLRIFAKKEQLEVVALFVNNKQRLAALSF